MRRTARTGDPDTPATSDTPAAPAVTSAPAVPAGADRVEAASVDADPVGTDSVEAASMGADPVGAGSVDAHSARPEPVGAEPVGTDPVGAEPVDTGPARPPGRGQPDPSRAPGAAPAPAGPASSAPPSPSPAPHARRMADTTLEWVLGHREWFRLPSDVLRYDSNVDFTLKPLGELTQLCVAIEAHSPPGSAARAAAAELLEFAWQETDEGELFAELQRAEPFATYPMEIYGAFTATGRRHPGYEHAAGVVARTRGWRDTEQNPTRRLGLVNAERRLGIPPHTSQEEALRRTWTGGRPEPWTFERAAGYGLTHVVFHLSDWGLSPGRVPAGLAGYLETWLPAWLDGCLEDEQWDLGAELLAVSACLPAPPPAAPTEEAWERMADAQDADGGLVEIGPGRRREPLPRDFVHCYHPTLVAAFAATLAVSRLSGGGGGRPPAAGTVRTPSSPGPGGHR